jgi:cyanate lyase
MVTRASVTEKIVLSRIKKRLSWKALAKAVGKSPAWTTAALLGQMAMSPEEAKAAGDLLDLTDDEQLLLTQCPTRGAIPHGPSTDPTIYRFQELLVVYGPAIKELIHEEFGDGIMSAIDFTMDLERVPDPKGDRVKVTLNGKFLAYKKY